MEYANMGILLPILGTKAAQTGHLDERAGHVLTSKPKIKSKNIKKNIKKHKKEARLRTTGLRKLTKGKVFR